MAPQSNVLVLEQTNPPPARQWTITSEQLTIGRDPEADIVIDDARVSRHHADLRRNDGGWSLVDTDSANGTFLNGARVSASAVHPGDRIRVGDSELVLTSADPDATDVQARPVPGEGAAPPPPPTPPPPPPPPAGTTFHVPSQQGNNWNVGGDVRTYQQRVEHRQSSLAFIASRRGMAKQLLVWGVVLYFAGAGIAMAAILSFQKEIFDRIDSQSTEPPDLPDAFIPMFGVGAFVSMVGFALFIFGLIVRGSARREQRHLEAGPPWVTTTGT